MRMLLIILAVLTTAVVARAQSVIELRPVARLAAEAPVRLADVAELRGPEALALAEVRLDGEELPSGRDGWMTVDVALVRGVLAGRKDVNWGRLSLVGRACAVRRAEPGHAGHAGHADMAEPAAGDQGAAAPAVDPARSVRGLVRARIAELVGADGDRLRVTFEDHDRSLLDEPVAGRRVELHPVGTSDKLPFEVMIYEGDRIAASGTVRADVRVKRPVVVLKRGLARGASISPEDVSADERWMGPRARPATAARAIGAVARSSLRAGEVLDDSDFEAPIVVKKGDLVTVHCLAGLVKVEMVARALGPGRDGEVVVFQAGDSKRTFQARMSGPGRAVVVTDGEQAEERS